MSSDFHGWSKAVFGGRSAACPALHIGRLPQRKGIALYEANGSVNILAWFRDEEAALRAVELIDCLVGLTAEVLKPGSVAQPAAKEG